MPYIPTDARNDLEDFASVGPLTPGELNYVLTRVCSEYIEHNYGGMQYHGINDVVGALDCVKLEMYRRLGGPYEDIQRAQHGDVFSAWLLRSARGGEG